MGTGFPIPADGSSELLAARIQMGSTLGFHIVVACLGVGLPLLMLFAEWRFLRTAEGFQPCTTLHPLVS